MTAKRIDPVMCPTCFGTFDACGREAEVRRKGFYLFDVQCPHCKRWRDDRAYDRFHTQEAIDASRMPNTKDVSPEPSP